MAAKAGAFLLLSLLLSHRQAAARPCLTCRTEKCPDARHIKEWCGSGADPNGHSQSSRRVPKQHNSASRHLSLQLAKAETVAASMPEPDHPRQELIPTAAPGSFVLRRPTLLSQSSSTELSFLPGSASKEGATRSPRVPHYKRWWVWAVVGITAATGVIAVSVAGASRPSDVISGGWKPE